VCSEDGDRGDTCVTDMGTNHRTCENCNAELGERDPVFVWYARQNGDVPGGASYHARRGCRDCFEEAATADFQNQPFGLRAAMRMLSGEQPHARQTWCERCERTVIVVTLTKYPGEDYERVIYCSAACRDARPGREKVCEVCGEEFTARSDAKTCSSACRQKAYRQRRSA
jgi:hypothetical protein